MDIMMVSLDNKKNRIGDENELYNMSKYGI